MQYLYKLENVKDNCEQIWKLNYQIISQNMMKKCIDEIIDNKSLISDHKRQYHVFGVRKHDCRTFPPRQFPLVDPNIFPPPPDISTPGVGNFPPIFMNE